jgi:opacity protein-like surface antigen
VPGTITVAGAVVGANPVLPGTIIALGSNSSAGWTVGAGFEWAFFGGDWSAFLEYDFMDFGTSRVTLASNLVSGRTHPLDISQKVSLVLFGINYRFWGGGPRY